MCSSTETLSAAVAFALLVAVNSCLAAEPRGVFVIDDGSDAIHLSDRPGAHAGSASLLIAVNLPVAALASAPAKSPPSISGRVDALSRQRDAIADIVLSAARSQHLDPALLHAVIGVESAYASRAVSARGAQGLMQLMPSTAKDYGVTDPFDPRQNVSAGARHLRALLDQFGQDTVLALAAYNAGAASVWRHGLHVPPYAETTRYVPTVLSHLAALRQRPARVAQLAPSPPFQSAPL